MNEKKEKVKKEKVHEVSPSNPSSVHLGAWGMDAVREQPDQKEQDAWEAAGDGLLEEAAIPGGGIHAECYLRPT